MATENPREDLGSTGTGASPGGQNEANARRIEEEDPGVVPLGESIERHSFQLHQRWHQVPAHHRGGRPAGRVDAAEQQVEGPDVDERREDIDWKEHASGLGGGGVPL